jgi:hypothetical protein
MVSNPFVLPWKMIEEVDAIEVMLQEAKLIIPKQEFFSTTWYKFLAVGHILNQNRSIIATWGNDFLPTVAKNYYKTRWLYHSGSKDLISYYRVRD